MVSGITGAEETPLVTGAAEGFATPVTPVDTGDRTTTLVNLVPASGATGVNLSSVVFQFSSTAGADSYVVDVSPDTTYAKKIILTPSQSVTINGNQTVTTTPVNLKTAFPGVTQFAFRIGARNSADNPGPSKLPTFQNNIRNPDLNPMGGSYIYGADAIFSGS